MMKKYELPFDEESMKFSLEKNVLDRNAMLINLMKLINALDENYIISIDGDWGSGKTFFIKQLIYLSMCENPCFFSAANPSIIKKFSEKNFVIYYNAWENDDHNSPLESLIYYIINEFSEKKNDIYDNKKLFELSKDIAKNFIEVSSFGIIKKEDIDKLKSFSDLTDKIVTSEEKKQALNKLFDYLTNSTKRLVLIIDELDRCRPDYAVKMLETLKHFYDNPNITVIVVTNNRELSYTISHFYGYNFDGYSYLNKIYNTTITLDNSHKRNYVQHMCKFSERTYLPESVSVLLFEFFDFTYREINSFISMYRLVEPYIEYKDYFDAKKYLPQSCVFLPLAIILKIRDIKLYKDFLSGNAIELLNNIFDDDRIKNDKNISYSWLSETFKKKENEKLIDAIIREYLFIFATINDYDSFPFMEAISMIGNKINVGN